jgi:Transmembrane protein 138
VRSVQLVVQVVNGLVVFLMLSGTYLFQVRAVGVVEGAGGSGEGGEGWGGRSGWESVWRQVGLLSLLLSEFTSALVVMPVYLVVFLVYSAVKVVKITEGASVYAMWDDSGFYFVGVLQKLVSIIYFFTMVSTAFRLGQRRWYAKEPWVRRFREQLPTGGSFGVTDID